MDTLTFVGATSGDIQPQDITIRHVCLVSFIFTDLSVLWLQRKGFRKSKASDIAYQLLQFVLNPEQVPDPIISQMFKLTIEPILLNAETSPPEAFVQRLLYTIIDQQRSVPDVVIPIWACLMSARVDAHYFKSAIEEGRLDEAIEIVVACFAAYGHDRKFMAADMENLQREGYYNRPQWSRSQSYVEGYEKLLKRYGRVEDPWQKFKEEVLLKRRMLGRSLNVRAKIRDEFARFVDGLTGIQVKSLSFYLRDIEPIPADFQPADIPMPVDSNVARAIQMSGIMFDYWKHVSSLPVIEIEKRDRYRLMFSKRVQTLAHVLKENYGIDRSETEIIAWLGRALFLLGVSFCKNCKPPDFVNNCPFYRSKACMISTAPFEQSRSFFRKLKGE